MANGFRERVSEFLFRNKCSDELNLTHRNIFILPSKLGGMFLFFILLVFVLGVNYQNNLLLLASYFFSCFFVYALITTFNNVYGLKLKLDYASPPFAPNHPTLKCSLLSKETCLGVEIIYNKKTTLFNEVTQNSILEIVLPINSRGKHCLDKLKIQSYYPFGLVKVWSYWVIESPIYVYPSLGAIKYSKISPIISDDHEFDCLTHFKPGMSQTRIYWRHYAKSKKLVVKEFSPIVENAETNSPKVLDFFTIEGDKETKISHLTAALLSAYETKHTVKLKLPSQPMVTCVTSEQYHEAWRMLSEL
ncbi:FIG002343: hypothetical protein [Pseudoalteromonas luteoviolacea B = ATCC 29581]|nr:FIG002343: hypothetical protein [Pseudoalteromonas luteoviolacea B = ATCC 29581]